MKKYLDENGLSYFWGQLEQVFGNASSAYEGLFANLKYFDWRTPSAEVPGESRYAVLHLRDIPENKFGFIRLPSDLAPGGTILDLGTASTATSGMGSNKKLADGVDYYFINTYLDGGRGIVTNSRNMGILLLQQANDNPNLPIYAVFYGSKGLYGNNRFSGTRYLQIGTGILNLDSYDGSWLRFRSRNGQTQIWYKPTAGNGISISNTGVISLALSNAEAQSV